MVNKPRKVNPQIQYYRYQGYGHLVSQWLSQTQTLFVEVPTEEIEEEENDVEVAVYQ